MQTRQDFQLFVRDDGSTDGTVEMLHEEVSRRPGRIHVMVDNLARLGPKSSFATLLQRAEARWIAFCDQDDQWMPDKLARQTDALERLEATYGTATPLLCCSDAAVTDAHLHITAPSYFAKHCISTANGRDLVLPRLLFRNYAIGATTMINTALARRCSPMPDEAIMHDWWCALVARVSGQSVVLQDALIRYRQHGRNAVGSPERPIPRTVVELKAVIERAQFNSARCVRQAQALHRTALTFPDEVAPAIDDVLRHYASFTSLSRLQRASTMLRTHAFKPGMALNALHLYACVTA